MGEADKVAVLIEECGGLDSLEALQRHDNENIYQKALTIIEDYFSEGVAEEVSNTYTNSEGQISFNPQSPKQVPSGGFSF